MNHQPTPLQFEFPIQSGQSVVAIDADTSTETLYFSDIGQKAIMRIGYNAQDEKAVCRGMEYNHIRS